MRTALWIVLSCLAASSSRAGVVESPVQASPAAASGLAAAAYGNFTLSGEGFSPASLAGLLSAVKSFDMTSPGVRESLKPVATQLQSAALVLTLGDPVRAAVARGAAPEELAKTDEALFSVTKAAQLEALAGEELSPFLTERQRTSVAETRDLYRRGMPPAKRAQLQAAMTAMAEALASGAPAPEVAASESRSQEWRLKPSSKEQGLRLLRDPDAARRIEAVDALSEAEKSDSDAVAPLVASLDPRVQPDAEVRGRAALALGKIGLDDPVVVAALTRRLFEQDEPAWTNRAYAAWALIEIAGARGLRIVRAVFATERDPLRPAIEKLMMRVRSERTPAP